MTDVRSDGQLEDKSIGELVAIATADVSRLIKAEMELAKLELKGDAKKAGLGGTLFAVAGLIGGIVLILLSIAAAYGLIELGVWRWLAFVIVAGVYVLLAAILIGIGLWRMKKMSRASRTRKTVKEDLAILRHRGGSDDKPALTG
ncbi:MAG: hypothetical protein JWR24_3146 [Actinoallomurus sp.]|jgi:uncharacterized membrane protein YqjE|nr:hypothetical protein [Actinoallomurus sp.]